MAAGRCGPWHRSTGTSWTVTIPGCGRAMVYEVEYRRAEPGATAGYYLFGPHLGSGLALDAGSAELARYEAFALIMHHVPEALANLPRVVG